MNRMLGAAAPREADARVAKSKGSRMLHTIANASKSGVSEGADGI